MMATNQNSASFNDYNLANRYPIHQACRHGDVKTLEDLLNMDSEKFMCEDAFNGWLPIHWAAYHGQLACIRKLLAYATTAALPMIQYPEIAIVETGIPEIWNSWIDARASNFRQTPVHLAAYGNHVECLKWLLDAGASPHLTDSLGETAAHKAARGGGIESLSLLQAHGVNLSVVNNAGQTAADVAAACGHTQCSAYLQRWQALQIEGSGIVASLGEEASIIMDIDQNTPEPALVNGTYGYQPAFTKPSMNNRKRGAQGELVLGPMDNEKRCKKLWNKDDANEPARQQQASQFTCTLNKGKPWMSGHCSI